MVKTPKEHIMKVKFYKDGETNIAYSTGDLFRLMAKYNKHNKQCLGLCRTNFANFEVYKVNLDTWQNGGDAILMKDGDVYHVVLKCIDNQRRFQRCTYKTSIDKLEWKTEYK